MGNTTEYEEITKFEITALVFFRLGRNNSLNNSEYAVVNEYLSNLKSISSTDVEIFNAVSDNSFFIKRYEHKNMGVFLNLSEIMFSIKTELYKHNIMIHEEQLRQLKTDSVYLLIKMFKLKKYYAPQSNDKNHNAKKSENIPITIHVYKSNKNDIECFTNHHSVTSKQFRCTNEYSNRTFNFWYCEECGKYLIRNKTYENNVKYFEGLNIKLIGHDEIPVIKSSLNKNISNFPSVNSILFNRSSSSQPIIVAYNNFSASSANCISKHHSIINKPLYTSQKRSTVKKLNSFFCTHCNIHYIQNDVYQMHKEKYGFEYKAVIGDTLTNIKTDEKNIVETIEKHISVPKTKEICLGDFLVRSSLMRCVNKNHQLSRVKASVSILTTNRGMIEEYFDASYCKDCDKSYILESTYNRLKALGHICCKVIEYEDLAQNYSVFSSWQKKSLLAMYGYNVNKQQALTEAKRHKILDILIQNKVMSSYEIISHLEMLIRTRKNMKNMADAREKWEDDIDYVQHYNKVDDSVKVKSIYAKRKI